MKFVLILVIIAAVIAFAAYAFRKKTFTYEEAMKYFAAHKKDDPRYVKGAIIKEKQGDSFLITQAFLDKDGNVLGGSKIRAASLDAELLNAFKDKDKIIVE
jgi:hypothetical protein